MEKIYITGTGRCGTTFLIKLFTFLNFDTGFTRLNYKRNIFNNCNSGMERVYFEKFTVIKSPGIISDISNILLDKNIKIKLVIIPIRDYKQSALSRVRHDKQAGGLWNATNVDTQMQFYNKIIADYIYYMTKYEINTIFLDFDKMVTDSKYLYDKLKFLFEEKNIDFETFSKTYIDVSETSKPK